jgi:hypothetical protein
MYHDNHKPHLVYVFCHPPGGHRGDLVNGAVHWYWSPRLFHILAIWCLLLMDCTKGGHHRAVGPHLLYWLWNWRCHFSSHIRLCLYVSNL